MQRRSRSTGSCGVVGEWMGVRLGVVPTASNVEAVADRVTSEWNKLLGAQSALDAVQKLGWTVESRPLTQPGTSIRSLLVPKLAGGFGIVLNTEQSPPELFNWLIAHEFAHSLFYTDGSPPRRIIQHTAAEEVFCDQFAEVVTGTSIGQAA